MQDKSPSIRRSPEYFHGYHDGYREGYNKALEDLQIGKVFQNTMRPIMLKVDPEEYDRWLKEKED